MTEQVRAKFDKPLNVSAGTVYEVEQIAKSQLKPLTEKEIKERIKIMNDYFTKSKDKYHMLLSNENKDYTVFKLNNLLSVGKAVLVFEQEWLLNRGKLISLEYTENKDALEIWIMIDGKAHMYYLFPYDFGMIEV